MTGDEFRQALHDLGWKQMDLCRKAGVHRNTVCGWAADGAPKWVGEYLRALVAIKTLHDAFILSPVRERLNDDSDEAHNEEAQDENSRAGRMARRLAAEGLQNSATE